VTKNVAAPSARQFSVRIRQAATAAGLIVCGLIGAAGAQFTLPGGTANPIAAVAGSGDAGGTAAFSPAQERALAALLRAAADEGLDPSRYDLGGAASPAQLRDAVLAYARDLRVPRAATVTYVDAALAPAAPDVLAAADPAKALHELQHGNRVYTGLRRGLAAYRARWAKLPQIDIPDGPPLVRGASGARVGLLRRRLGVPGPDRFDEALGRAVQAFQAAHGLGAKGAAGAETIAALNAGAAHYERLIAANMDRARGLPLDGRRFLLVDSAGAVLRLFDGGEERGAMRVIVGKPGMETPELAGLVRFAIANPSWNVPPDLVRRSVAPRVAREGTGYLAKRRFELFADWRPGAAALTPEAIDWPAVAAGREKIWVRQLPGGDNMMGRVKFMLPNRLGIYLHDTPRKGDFARSDRRLSSGCVRVEDAQRLAGWIFGNSALLADAATPDTKIDVANPVPVYILYFTAFPENGTIRFQPDRYSRDPPLLARLAALS